MQTLPRVLRRAALSVAVLTTILGCAQPDTTPRITPQEGAQNLRRDYALKKRLAILVWSPTGDYFTRTIKVGNTTDSVSTAFGPANIWYWDGMAQGTPVYCYAAPVLQDRGSTNPEIRVEIWMNGQLAWTGNQIGPYGTLHSGWFALPPVNGFESTPTQ